MFVAVYPASPTQTLIAGLLDAGYQPVPIESLEHIEERLPEGGWAVAVVEVTSDLGRSLAVSAKITDEYGLPVLLLIVRHDPALPVEDHETGAGGPLVDRSDVVLHEAPPQLPNSLP